jgi:hypothetical protein
MGGMKGRQYVEEQTVKPGRVRWKVQFLTENRDDAPDAAMPQGAGSPRRRDRCSCSDRVEA